MPVLIRDIESRGELRLDKVGVHRYAADSHTEVMCVGYCVDYGPIKIWHPGDPVPEEFREAGRNQDYTMVAHNAAFEMTMERRILAPRFGFPVIPIKRNVCTMATALAMALPPQLDRLTKALNMTERKDIVGKRVMMQLAKPRKARKNEDPDGVYWYDDDKRKEQLDEYCKADVSAEREVYYELFDLSDDEARLWLLDQKINNRGFYIDQPLAEAARAIADAAYPMLDQEITTLTGGAVTAVTQVARLIKWLHDKGLWYVETLDKEDLSNLLGENLQPDVRRALELRQLGAQAAVKKVDAFLLRREYEGRIRGAYQFHSAGTGRWSSKGAQVHNLKRLPDDFDVEKAIKVIGSGSYTKVRKVYNNPLEVIGTLMRPMIIAEPGNELWGADFSGIEARVTAWVAHEETKLNVFRAYDAGKGFDPYIVAAAKIYKIPEAQIVKEQRQVGKACELAFGFQGGVKAFRKFSAGSFSDDEVDEFKEAWRTAHPNIAKYWRDLNDAFHEAVTLGELQSCFDITIEYSKEAFRLPTVFLRLPSGRMIVYPDIGMRKGYRDGQPEGRGVYFKDNTAGQWRDVRVYGGLIMENLVQGIARDLLAEAMMRLDAAGFEIVGHTHDEVLVEEPLGSKRLDQFNKIMNTVPDWAEGLPIVAKSWTDKRYVK